MQPRFWHERWRTAQVGFHQAAPDRLLQRFWATLKLPASGQVFVPLCGKSLDLLWLQRLGHPVAGVEISSIALEAFLLEHGIAARRRPEGTFDVYESEGLRLFGGDFFSLTSTQLGPISAVYDRAALISWSPELRDAYVRHIDQVTAQASQTLLISVEYPRGQMAGPPFAVDADEVDRLYGRNHSICELWRDDILGQEPRLRARGLTQLFEVCYRLVRAH